MKNKNKERNLKTPKKDPQSCWEFWKCPEEIQRECTAFQAGMGKQCWVVRNISKKNQASRRNLDCIDCEWYKIVNKK